MISASDIRDKRFEKAAFGYKQEEIDDFLAMLIEEFDEIDAEREDLHSKIQILADKVREYRQDEDALKDALLGAQKQGHKVVAEAQEKADEIIAQAESKANELIEEATVAHEAAMEKNRQEIEKEKQNLYEAQRQVTEFKKTLFDMYKSHLEMTVSYTHLQSPIPLQRQAFQQETLKGYTNQDFLIFSSVRTTPKAVIKHQSKRKKYNGNGL